ncbi:uncharacterized protein LOC126842099 [Adelges cooleyi]|uniref:uncharacterized protein LOC126842099 n=1 Tax=Adelges cooleyi TaxID=133065 RepID=UPI00217FB9E6|nr:uncharacterized protein LOC126842099 [Adelges cooleyi]
MHFKSTLFVSMMLFLTSTWSTGLDSVQLIRLHELFENHSTSTNGVDEEQIAQVVKEYFGLEWKDTEKMFNYNKDESDSLNLNNLLLTLAKKGEKSSDKVKKLTFSDVSFYLEEFEECNELGYLNLQQLSKVFTNWKTVNDALNAKSEELKNEKGEDHKIIATEFLLIMIEIKPEGHGLNIAQIETFDSLYEAHKTSGSIDRVACEKVFEELGITVNDELELLFNSQRPAERLLMDLIILAAERNTVVEENELSVLRLNDVVTAINEFIKMDRNNDYVLSPEEYEDYLNGSSTAFTGSAETVRKAENYLRKFDGFQTINALEYIESCIFHAKTSNDFKLYTVGDNSQALTILI